MRGFLEKFSRIVNLNELVFDLTLSITAIIVYRLIVPKAGFLFSGSDIPFTIAVIVCVQFFTALFFAGILKRYDEMQAAVKTGAYPPADSKPGFTKRFNKRLAETPAVGILLGIFVFAAVTSLYILMPMSVNNVIAKITMEAADNDPNRYLGMFVFFLTGVIVILPGVLIFKDDKGAIRWMIIISLLFAYEALAFPFSIVYFAFLGGAVGAILFVLITAGAVTGTILLKRCFIDKDFTAIPAVKKIAGPLKMFVIPFFTAIAMIVWSELSMISAAQDLIHENLAVNMANIFPYLLLSGLVPVRVVILFAPPVKPLNILISAVTMYLFFVNLDSVLVKLSGLMVPLK
ncbi:MAG: hypothetical protein A2Y33_11785 [Spirochaetes bacterium GWF1_51_8]|nr:MAG: hypothetical protein A2Y33_11785 [Spirochaetes bacterium GWF1_51_8]